MVVEVSVAVIAAVFVLLVVFLIIAIVKALKTLKEVNRFLHSSKKELDEISVEGLKLIKNLNETTSDIKRKLHALDGFFSPFLGRREEGEHKKHKEADLATDIIECVASGLTLYNKIKEGIRTYVKSR